MFPASYHFFLDVWPLLVCLKFPLKLLLFIFNIAVIAGPFALPAFLIMIVAFVIVGQIVFDTVRDIPVLGAFT